MSGGWQPRSAAEAAPPIEHEPERPSLLARGGGALLMLAGLLSFLAAVQLQVVVLLDGWHRVMPPLFVVLGIATVITGGSFMRARRWAVLAGLGLGGAGMLINVAWIAYAAYHHFFSMWGFFATVGSVLGLLGAALGARDALTADAARRALMMD